MVPRMVANNKREAVRAIKVVAQARDTWPRNIQKFRNFEQKWYPEGVRCCDARDVMASKILFSNG